MKPFHRSPLLGCDLQALGSELLLVCFLFPSTFFAPQLLASKIHFRLIATTRLTTPLPTPRKPCQTTTAPELVFWSAGHGISRRNLFPSQTSGRLAGLLPELHCHQVDDTPRASPRWSVCFPHTSSATRTPLRVIWRAPLEPSLLLTLPKWPRLSPWN